MITVFLGVIAVTEVLLFIKVMIDFILALHFRKRDKKYNEEIGKSLGMLAYQTTQLNSRVTALENKDSEWHYPSKGEFPKECEDVLVYCKGEDFKFCHFGYIIVGGDGKIRWWSSSKELHKKELHVVAWKKIIVPEIKEEADGN